MIIIYCIIVSIGLASFVVGYVVGVRRGDFGKGYDTGFAAAMEDLQQGMYD